VLDKRQTYKLVLKMLSVVIFKPEIDATKLDAFCSKYNPHAKLISPHITLVSPLHDKKISKEELVQHIQKVISTQMPFEIRLHGLEKSWDHWLNLIVDIGNDDIIKLHDRLYSGILEPFWRKDLPFTPHIGIGLFVKNQSNYDVSQPTLQEFDEDKYNDALKEAITLGFDYQTLCNSVELVTLDDELTCVIETEKFSFK